MDLKQKSTGLIGLVLAATLLLSSFAYAGTGDAGAGTAPAETAPADTAPVETAPAETKTLDAGFIKENKKFIFTLVDNILANPTNYDGEKLKSELKTEFNVTPSDPKPETTNIEDVVIPEDATDEEKKTLIATAAKAAGNYSTIADQMSKDARQAAVNAEEYAKAESKAKSYADDAQKAANASETAKDLAKAAYDKANEATVDLQTKGANATTEDISNAAATVLHEVATAKSNAAAAEKAAKEAADAANQALYTADKKAAKEAELSENVQSLYSALIELRDNMPSGTLRNDLMVKYSEGKSGGGGVSMIVVVVLAVLLVAACVCAVLFMMRFREADNLYKQERSKNKGKFVSKGKSKEKDADEEREDEHPASGGLTIEEVPIGKKAVSQSAPSIRTSTAATASGTAVSDPRDIERVIQQAIQAREEPFNDLLGKYVRLCKDFQTISENLNTSGRDIQTSTMDLRRLCDQMTSSAASTSTAAATPPRPSKPEPAPQSAAQTFAAFQSAARSASAPQADAKTSAPIPGQQSFAPTQPSAAAEDIMPSPAPTSAVPEPKTESRPVFTKTYHCNLKVVHGYIEIDKTGGYMSLSERSDDFMEVRPERAPALNPTTRKNMTQYFEFVGSGTRDIVTESPCILEKTPQGYLKVRQKGVVRLV